jgi:hypothetical protein
VSRNVILFGLLAVVAMVLPPVAVGWITAGDSQTPPIELEEIDSSGGAEPVRPGVVDAGDRPRPEDRDDTPADTPDDIGSDDDGPDDDDDDGPDDDGDDGPDDDGDDGPDDDGDDGPDDEDDEDDDDD